MKSNFRDSPVWFARMLGLLFSLAALSGCALAISQDIIEQAKKEGEAVLYTTMPVGEFQIFNQAAKEKYTFLNIRHVRINSGNQAPKVLLEHKAGKMQVDVIGNNLAAMRYFKEQGVLAKSIRRKSAKSSKVRQILYGYGLASPAIFTSPPITRNFSRSIKRRATLTIISSRVGKIRSRSTVACRTG